MAIEKTRLSLTKKNGENNIIPFEGLNQTW